MIRTSFPYLKIAREYGVSYGAVLLYSDAIEHASFEALNCWELASLRGMPSPAATAISFAVLDEKFRRENVQNQRSEP